MSLVELKNLEHVNTELQKRCVKLSIEFLARYEILCEAKKCEDPAEKKYLEEVKAVAQSFVKSLSEKEAREKIVNEKARHIKDLIL